jgi:Zn-dependent M16 (insulinase) family peptidase
MLGGRIAGLLFVTLASCHQPVTPQSGGLTRQGTAVPAPQGEPTLETLTAGQHAHGFTAIAQYLDDARKPIGARFRHDATGFVFDYLRIESAPQGFLYVHSFPTSDKGEPHTQEHLLLGKGNRGRRLGSDEAMALAESSAFTEQWRTAYHFHTVAGGDAFWQVFANQLDALLHPDYTDEEIRREVRNFGVDRADDGSLRLEEKGTVYNEMVGAYEEPDVVLARAAGQLVYGAKHPLAFEPGGHPDAIRTMTPHDIRVFREAAYHLPNMGMVGAFPAAMRLNEVLEHAGAILGRQADGTGHVMTQADLPKPSSAAPGTIQVVEYPYSDTTNPGPLELVWPASRELDLTERTLLELFLDAVAGDESTPLYKKLIDGNTRTIDLGASGLGASVSPDQGQPVTLSLSSVKADKLDAKTVDAVRGIVLAELQRIAKLPDGDPELIALDARVQSRVTSLRRQLAKLLDTSPGFGARSTGSGWLQHLDDLAKTPGFDKSLTLKAQLAQIEQLIAAPHNPWRQRIAAWGLTTVPFGLAARPSLTLRNRLDAERKQRIADELARLQKQYGTPDAATTLARYQNDYEAATRALEASARTVELPPLVATPPMTLDDDLHYQTGELAGVRSFVATFDAMASARVELAFPVVGVVPAEDQFLLAALPGLIRSVGVLEDGKPIGIDDMRERLRNEILELSVEYDSNPRTGRVELVVAGSGNGVDETKAALAWMHRVMLSPDWRVENLPRLRDVVDHDLTQLRQVMLGPEEAWVKNPRDAWWRQSSLEYLHTSSFLTAAHDLHRLRWMLLDPGDAKARGEAARFLGELAGAYRLARVDLMAIAKGLADGEQASTEPKAATRWTDAAHRLSAKAAPIAREAGKDLAALLGDLPDSALAGDWAYLCRQMAHDLQVGAPAALARLEAVRALVVRATDARLVEVGSTANQVAIAQSLAKLVRELPTRKLEVRPTAAAVQQPLAARVLDRKESGPLTYLGLLDPATSSGVFVDLAHATSYADSDDDKLLDYLASNLYTGHGAHSMFTKTWAAGLAYSNGLHSTPELGTVDYYAERCPLLPQTLRFVIDQLKKEKPDPNLVRYAIANAFQSRIADDYERRAAAMAADLVDGVTPDLVRGFRTRLLALAQQAGLANVLFARLPEVYGKVLPGYARPEAGSLYLVIGPESQLAAYEQYLSTAVGRDARLHRLYPRDFWIPGKL